MKRWFYPRLAWTGIRKNSRLYVPYLLSSVGMVMMYCILETLYRSPSLEAMRGGSSVQFVLSLGRYVIAAFALLFLFYTHSFLLRRRFREFGLYNVLGMDKRGICRVMCWESLIVSVISLAGGIGLGMALSKLAELGFVNAVKGEVDYEIPVSWAATGNTALIFAGVFFLLFLRALVQVCRMKPLELMRSESAGERPPKQNLLVAVLGVLLLGAAYGMAVTIRSPLSALVLFFVAVLMVIAATYLLFVSGSVTLCRLLQKNKRYYYQTRHFVSVSSMAYRMRRNGEGLASICILCTMVLVMLSSTASLYIGANDALASRFPQENEMNVSVGSCGALTDENMDAFRGRLTEAAASCGGTPENVTTYRYVTVTGLLTGDRLQPDPSVQFALLPSDALTDVVFLYAADYTRLTGEPLTLRAGEAYAATADCVYEQPELRIGELTLRIAGTLDEMPSVQYTDTPIIPTILLVIGDDTSLSPLDTLTVEAERRFYFGYDMDADEDTILRSLSAVRDAVKEMEFLRDDNGFSYESSCLAAERDDFFTTFGGLFFLGITLSIVFLFAAAMIIYYKQVSEGYEDRARFGIMQKVGMSDADIRKSINSQVLTVFFAPLLMAGLHMVFAFPMVWKILNLFHLTNLKLVILVTVGAFVLFGAFYALIYKATARAYYRIVSE